jgi:hypothetical protein
MFTSPEPHVAVFINTWYLKLFVTTQGKLQTSTNFPLGFTLNISFFLVHDSVPVIHAVQYLLCESPFKGTQE